MTPKQPNDSISDPDPNRRVLAISPSVSPAVLLQRFLSGQVADPEVSAWLSQGFTAWWRSGGTVPLTACLHLPATSSGCARVARDAWLRAAANCLPARSRASSLSNEIDRFRQAPEQSLVHQYLAFASACGIPLPSTARQVRNILAETPPGFDFRNLQSAAEDCLMHIDTNKSPSQTQDNAPQQAPDRRALLKVFEGGRRQNLEDAYGQAQDSQRTA